VTRVVLTPEMLKDFVPRAIDELAPRERDNIVFEDVNWVELTSEWLSEAKLNREASKV